jgi:hypothetical protein
MRLQGIVLAAGLVFAPVVANADAVSETVTAQTHADLAAHASDLMGVHMHLHHAVNCLVGPAGAGFDAKELNPCANAGSGAIPDTTDAGRKKLLEQAVTKAESGIASSHFAAAQKAASDTAAMLKGK